MLVMMIMKKRNLRFGTVGFTFQNYFRMYNKLAGMTGTAATEAAEFMEIYGLEVVEVPTNMPMIRVDYPDLIFKTQREKLDAVLEAIVWIVPKEVANGNIVELGDFGSFRLRIKSEGNAVGPPF